MNVSLDFFPVPAGYSPAPYDGDPPVDAYRDVFKVAEHVDPKTESNQADYDLTFAIEKPAGFYYLQVSVILYRKQPDRLFAQVERFFFKRRPLPLTEEASGHLTLPVQWPQIPLEKLHTYGVVRPEKK